MSRRDRTRGGSLALLAALALALGACGDDEEETTAPTGTTDAVEEFETTTVPESEAPPPAGPEAEPEPYPEGESQGGVSAGEGSGGAQGGVSPEDQPGGAGDEGNDPIEGGSGGGKGGGGDDPKDAFEQYCEENPRACE